MSHSKLAYLPVLLSFVLLSAVPGSAAAQDEPNYTDNYITPPETISDEILAPRHESVTLNNLSPDGRFFLNQV